MIEMGKTYRTRNGRDARLVAVDSVWAFGFVGTMRPCIWNADTGKASDRFEDLGGADTDLVEVKPTITRTIWCVWLGDAWLPVRCESSQKLAQLQGATFDKPYSVTGPHEITFQEGEGLS